MRPALALLLAALLLSGCLAAARPAPAAARPAAAPVALDGFGDDAMEPHVALRAAPGGPVVVVANMNKIPSPVPGNTLPIGIEVHRSLNGGRTWASAPLPRSVFAPFDPLGQMPNSGDAVLAYAPDGTLFLGGVATAGTSDPGHPELESLRDFSVWVSRSSDDGATWSPALFWQRGHGPVVALVEDKEWIAVGPDGTLHFAWTEFTGLVGTRIRYAQSGDGGHTWTAPRDLVLPNLQTFSQVTGAVIAAPGGGRVYVAYLDIRGDGQPSHQAVIASRDNGATFGPAVQLGTAAFPRFGTVFADRADPLHAFAAAPSGDATPLMQLAETRDGGATWSTPAPVAAARGGAQQHPAGWVARDGRVVLGFYDAGWPGGERFTFTVLQDGAAVEETAVGNPTNPGVYRREYLGLAGSGNEVWAAWVAGDEATGTWVEAARHRL